mmetsp:Transcript_15389/g.39020  ORF Transcript_15389/g.39020 Transcript_15389/m.39020 type:complete len:559 (+) Transcript_15389:53-1729(+)
MSAPSRDMSADDDGDVEITGATGFDALRDAPHARCHCLVHPIKAASGSNTSSCAFCVCFVCEQKPSACKAWTAHCNAVDSDPTWIAARHKCLRRNQAEANAPSAPRGPPAGPAYVPPVMPPGMTPAQLAQAMAMSAAMAAAQNAQLAAQALAKQAAREAEHEQDEHDEVTEEVFVIYTPKYVTLGSPHPDPVCETTSLAFAAVPMPTYVPIMPMPPGALSTLQAETLVYACQRFEKDNADGCRGGFFLGDGVGLGKGRQLAAIIYENWLRGRRRHLWFSASADLIVDASRDLEDIGAEKIPLHALNKLPYGKLESKSNGVMDGVIFATYSSLIAYSGNKTRMDQLVSWMKDGDAAGEGCVCFDEAHKAKNLCDESKEKDPDGERDQGDGGDGPKKKKKTGSSKTAVAVRDIQQRLPRSRVVYCSATGASSVKAMAYMVRLALWGPGTSFPAFSDFYKAIERGSTGALELVALEMKQRGSYIARQLSFHTASFQTKMVDLNEDERELYDGASRFWAKLFDSFVHANEMFKQQASEDEGDGKKRAGRLMSQFWGAHQRFF